MPTEILSLPEIAEAQASKYVTHNEALRHLEAYLVGVLSRRASPPESPDGGDTHIVQPAEWVIVAVDDGDDVFSVEGDQSGVVEVDDLVTVDGSTGNDGQYTVISVDYDSELDRTDIEVDGVDSATADGTLRHASGEWNGHADEIAHYYSGAWAFYPPPRGIELVVLDTGERVFWNPDTQAWETLSGSGDVLGASASDDGELPRFDGSGGTQLQRSGLRVDDDDRLWGHGSKVREISGTSYTLVASDNGRVITTTNSDPVTITLPEQATATLPPGFQCVVIQRGDGDVTFTTEGDDTTESKDGYTSIAGRHSIATVLLLDAGDPNTWGLYGDLA